MLAARVRGTASTIGVLIDAGCDIHEKSTVSVFDDVLCPSCC